MALALEKNSATLQTSYPRSTRRHIHPSPPRYFTPSRSSRTSAASSHNVSMPVQSIARVSQLLFRTLLIGIMSIGFMYCASAIVGSSSNVFLKLIGLSAWACGFVPLVYYLWHSKIG